MPLLAPDERILKLLERVAPASIFELAVMDETAAAWMTTNNCVDGWSANQKPNVDYKDKFWNGVMFKIPKEYKNFITNNWDTNLATIVIYYDWSQTLMIPHTDLDHKWIQVVAAKSGRSSDPMSVAQSWASLAKSLHKSVNSYRGGILAWDSRSPFSLRTDMLATLNYFSRYTFMFRTDEAFEVAIYKEDDPGSKDVVPNVKRIEIHGDIGGPGDPIFNPPQW